jgi:hypothetical protein
VQIVYDAENVYFGFVVTDEYHENAANSAWNGDSVQLMIASADRTRQGALYNYALGGVETNLLTTIVNHEAGPGGTTATVIRDGLNKKTIYEIKLPAAALGLTVPLTLGAQFGLGMAINDGDLLTPGQKGWGGLGAHALVFGKSPGQTALVTLGKAGSGASVFFLSGVNPGVNTFKFRANDLGTSIVDPATAKLRIDGVLVPVVASPKVLDATDFTYTRATPFAGGNHTYAIEVKDTLNQTVTDSGSFISTTTPYLAATARAVSVDTTKTGFIWRVFQNEGAHLDLDPLIATAADYLAQCELALAGKLPDPANPPAFFANLANPDFPGVALAPGTLDGTLVKFEIPAVAYLNEAADGVAFNPAPPLLAIPVPADQMPGVPGRFGGSDGIDAEIRTFVELPAGVTRLGIGCRAYFRAQGGLINNPTNGVTLLGEGVGNPGQNLPVIMNVFAEAAGVYPLRFIYQDLAGAAWFSLYSLKDNGDSVLLGEVANGGLKAYRVGVVPGPSVSFSLVQNGKQLTWTEPGAVLQESTNLSTWTDKLTATSPYTVVQGGNNTLYYRLKK